MKCADSIIIATAVYESIPTVHTFDGDGGKRKAGMLKLGGKIGTPPVEITTPNPTEGTLWSEEFRDEQEKAKPTETKADAGSDTGASKD